MTTGLWPTLRDEALELLLLRQTEAKRRALSRAQLDLATEHARATERRLSALPGFSDLDACVVSATLLRAAADLVLRAKVIAEVGIHAEHGADLDTAAEVQRICNASSKAPVDWPRAVALLKKNDRLGIDRTPLEDLRAEATALLDVIRWVQGGVDLRSPEHVQWQRRGRVAALAIACVWCLLHFAHSALALPNVALGKPVQMSSYAHRSPTGAALVDGARSSKESLSSATPDFVQTNQESAPSATIDLGRNYNIAEIKVYNRADMNFDDGLPYIVEVSTDGSTFQPLATRTTHFGSTMLDPPWTIDARNAHAHFVRVRCSRYLALSEVEVYGK